MQAHQTNQVSHWLRVSLVCCVVPSLVACGATNADKRSLAKQSLSVTQPAQMAFEPLPFGSTVDVVLDASSPVYRFKARNGHYQAFQLPAKGADMSLVFDSKVQGGWAGRRSVFRPGVLFLDDSKLAIELKTALLFSQRFNLLEKNQFFGRVRVPENARYAVIYPESDRAFVTGESRPIGFDGSVTSAQTGRTNVLATTEQVATIEDTVEQETDTRIRVFAVSAIDGKSVSNARGVTRAANYGMGFHVFRTATRTREIAAKKVTVSVIGTHQMGAPIHEIAARVAGTFYEVDGDFQFEPKPWIHYRVRGRLTRTESSIWIERADDGVQVTGTISVRPRDPSQEQRRDSE